MNTAIVDAASSIVHAMHVLQAATSDSKKFQGIELIVQILLAAFTALMWWSTRSVATGTAGLSRETNSVAKETAELARETIAARFLADQHHQEAMTPVVIIDRGFVLMNSKGMLFGATLRNVGPGVALNIRIKIAQLGEIYRVGAIEASGTRDISFSVPESLICDDQPQDKESAEEEPVVQPIVIDLIFQNLFNSEGRTENQGMTGNNHGAPNCWISIFYPPPIASRVSQGV